MAKHKLAFVLGGGGSRGAMQVGAIQALLEKGYHPDIVTGTSIGAVNGTFFAINGFDQQGILEVKRLWTSMSTENFFSLNRWWETARSLLLHNEGVSKERIRELARAHGLTPNLCFSDLQKVAVYVIGADMNSGHPVIYGTDPDQNLLDSVMVSIALPPWMSPYELGGQYLVDGGFVSNLPIEAALDAGATEIIALDLFDPHEKDLAIPRVPAWITKLNRVMVERQLQLELKLAAARSVPVRYIRLVSHPTVAFWDFSKSLDLIEYGYRVTCKVSADWQKAQPAAWWSRFLDVIK